MNRGDIQINGENRKRDLQFEKQIGNFNNRKKAQGVVNGEDFERFQNRLESVGGNREIYDIVFGQPGDYPAMD